MKYKDWLDVWFANYIEPSSKTKTCERYSEIIEKHLKVKLGEYELEELSPIVIQKYITELICPGGIPNPKKLRKPSRRKKRRSRLPQLTNLEESGDDGSRISKSARRTFR